MTRMMTAFLVPVRDPWITPTGHVAVRALNDTDPELGKVGRALSKAFQPRIDGHVVLSHAHAAFRVHDGGHVMMVPDPSEKIARILEALEAEGLVSRISVTDHEIGLPRGPRTHDVPGAHYPKMFQDDDYGGMVAVSLDQTPLEIMLELERAGLATIVRRNLGSRDRWCLKGRRGTLFGFELDRPLCVTGDNWRFHDIMVRNEVPKRAEIFEPHLKMYPACQAFR